MAYKPKHQAAGKRILPTILKVLYLILVALCAVVVVLFIVYKTTVKPPEVETTEKIEIIVQPEPTTKPNGTVDDTPEPTVTTIELVRKKDFHTFLLMGTDDGNGNADTIMVGAFDLKNHKILSKKLDNALRVSFIPAGNDKISVSIAYGVAVFTPGEDETFNDVFQKADHSMYLHKQQIKEAV